MANTRAKKTGRVKRVRIAVVIDDRGRYGAVGLQDNNSVADPWCTAYEECGCLSAEIMARAIVEADIPLPPVKPPVVKARAVKPKGAKSCPR